jgi:hypothetical protein
MWGARLSISSLMGERDVLGDGSWQGREERHATALGIGLAEEGTRLARIQAREGGPPISTEYLRDDGFVLDHLVGFVLDHSMQIQWCKNMQQIKIPGLMRINK